MANLQVKDGADATKYLKTSGAGTDGDAHIPEHLETNSADILTAAEAIQTAAEAVQTSVELLDNIVSGSEAQVDVVAALPAGTNAIGKLAANSGVDIGDVDVLSSALPTGASTAALQTSSEALLTTIDADTSTMAGAVDGTEVQADVVSSALPTGAATSALQTSSEALLTTIDADTSSLAGTVSGSEQQVDVVAALPAGDNNIGNVDIASALPAGTNAIGKLAANSGVDIGDVDVTSIAAGSNLIGKTQPHAAMTELGVTELVGINEQVDTDDYGGSVGVALGDTYSGELLNFVLHATEDDGGAVLESTGQLLIFDADPTITSGDTAISNAERLTLIGIVDVTADHWLQSDANGATAIIKDQPVAFHAVSTLYFAWFHTLATSINSDAGDDEQLEFNAWYRRDS